MCGLVSSRYPPPYPYRISWTNQSKDEKGDAPLPVPVVDVTVTLVHEQDVVHFVLDVERVRRDGLVQREGIIAHVRVSQCHLRR